MEWITKRAKELYVSSSGLSKPADQFGFGYPFLSYKDIFHNYYAPKELSTLVNSDKKDRAKCSVHRGDVFLTRTSETTDELGMSCVALQDYPEATFNGFAKRLRPITDEIYPEYAAYFFRSAYFRAQCKSMASLITRASLNDAMISRFKIKYPKDKNAQIKIGTLLKNYDMLIENNTKRIKLLEQMAENLYKEWFVRFRFPGYENVEMKNGLPNGWKIERLGNISNISTGKCNREDAEEEGEYPLFDRSQEIKRSSVWIKDCEAIIVPGEGTSFMPRYFKGKFNLHQRCYCVNPNMDNIGFFLFYTLMLNRMYFLSVATGATVPSLRQNNFTKMKFIMPTIELIHKFNSIVQNARNCCDNLYKQNEFLTRQRDLLLPRLMSGKLEVKP